MEATRHEKKFERMRFFVLDCVKARTVISDTRDAR